jgi:hypothetical protein
MGVVPQSIKGPDLLARVSFPLTFSAVGAIGLVAITAMFAYTTQSIKETLIFFLAGATCLGQVTASFYTARMLGATLAIRREDIQREQKRSAMHFGTRWNDPGMYPVRDVLREIMDHGGSQDQLIDIIEGKRTHVVHVINFLEEIATAKAHGMSDDGLLRTQFSGVVAQTWSKVFPWVQVHRRRRNASDLWEDLEGLYNDWK